jgi:uncharacterized protein (TIGR02453 family)
MIEKHTLDFLKKISKNNNKEWFDKNRDAYLAAKLNIENFTALLIPEIAKISPPIGLLKPRDCMFRIFRDVRFSKNKAPYKTNMGAYFAEGGKKSMKGGYYLHIEPGKSFLAGGVYMPPNEVLNAIRQEVDYNTSEFKKIIGKKSFKNTFGEISGDKLKTVPKGYSKEHPEIELLKYKSYIVWHQLSDAEVLDKNFLKKTMTVFKELKPFNDFLNRSI